MVDVLNNLLFIYAISVETIRYGIVQYVDYAENQQQSLDAAYVYNGVDGKNVFLFLFLYILTFLYTIVSF